MPAPVKSVLRSGWKMRDGYAWCSIPYSSETGLQVENDGLVLVVDIREADAWTGFGYKAEYALCMTRSDGSFSEFWEKSDGYTEDDIEGVLEWAYERAEKN